MVDLITPSFCNWLNQIIFGKLAWQTAFGMWFVNNELGFFTDRFGLPFNNITDKSMPSRKKNSSMSKLESLGPRFPICQRAICLGNRTSGTVSPKCDSAAHSISSPSAPWLNVLHHLLPGIRCLQHLDCISRGRIKQHRWAGPYRSLHLLLDSCWEIAIYFPTSDRGSESRGDVSSGDSQWGVLVIGRPSASSCYCLDAQVMIWKARKQTNLHLLPSPPYLWAGNLNPKYKMLGLFSENMFTSWQSSGKSLPEVPKRTSIYSWKLLRHCFNTLKLGKAIQVILSLQHRIGVKIAQAPYIFPHTRYTFHTRTVGLELMQRYENEEGSDGAMKEDLYEPKKIAPRDVVSEMS